MRHAIIGYQRKGGARKTGVISRIGAVLRRDLFPSREQTSAREGESRKIACLTSSYVTA
jgi:hypothetical protein